MLKIRGSLLQAALKDIHKRQFNINGTEADLVQRADLVLMSGNVSTMNPSQPSAEAIAVKGDRILKVGTNDDITRLVGKKTKVITLEGKTVVPGFIDTHVHVVDFGRVLSWVDLASAKSVREIQTIIRQRAKKAPRGKWIIGRGWDQNCFVEKRLPTCADLDAVSPVNPVVLYHRCEQVCVVNTRALEIADVTKQTSAPQNGALDKDYDGELTGILRGDATNLVWKKVPEPTEEELVDGAYLACQTILQAGVTSVHWILTSSTEIPIIQRLRAENRLPLRIYVIVPANLLDDVLSLGLHEASGDNMLRIGGALIFADGFLADRTAALREPYNDDPATKGKLMYTQHEMNELAAKIHRVNLQLIVHAMGDLAVDSALTAIEAISRTFGNSHRCRLEQAALLDKQLIQRIKKQDVTISVQPCVVESEFSVWSAPDHLGIERARRLYPIKTLLREGVRVIGGSDCPMEPLNPLTGLQTATSRKCPSKERITIDDALRLYTVNAAYATLEEDVKGSLEEEKLADLTVLSNDPTSVTPDKLADIKVELTIIGGKLVYQRQ
jgi:predicted amidohydrolase YtcJ